MKPIRLKNKNCVYYTKNFCKLYYNKRCKNISSCLFKREKDNAHMYFSVDFGCFKHALITWGCPFFSCWVNDNEQPTYYSKGAQVWSYLNKKTKKKVLRKYSNHSWYDRWFKIGV